MNYKEKVVNTINQYNTENPEGVALLKKYEKLADVFFLAHQQACEGKGKERHALKGERFEDQQICQLGRWLGSEDFELGQAIKKCLEVNRLDTPERKIHELLGAINFIAAAVILLQEKQKQQIPKYKPGEVILTDDPNFIPDPKRMPDLERR